MVSLGVFPPFLCGRTGRQSLRAHSHAAVLHWGDRRPRGGGPGEKYWDQVGARRMLRCHPFPHRHLSTTHLLSSHTKLRKGLPFEARCYLGSRSSETSGPRICAKSARERGSPHTDPPARTCSHLARGSLCPRTPVLKWQEPNPDWPQTQR